MQKPSSDRRRARESSQGKDARAYDLSAHPATFRRHHQLQSISIIIIIIMLQGGPNKRNKPDLGDLQDLLQLAEEEHLLLAVGQRPKAQQRPQHRLRQRRLLLHKLLQKASASFSMDAFITSAPS